MNDPHRTRPGFTLVDFILYFGLIGLFLTGVIAFAVDYTKSYNKALIISRVGQESRFGLQRILRTVRQAAKINAASVFDDDMGTLALDTVATSTTPTVFDVSGGALRIREGSATATPLTSGEVVVQKLRFSKDAPIGNTTAVTVELTVSYVGPFADKLLSYSLSASGTAVVRRD